MKKKYVFKILSVLIIQIFLFANNIFALAIQSSFKNPQIVRQISPSLPAKEIKDKIDFQHTGLDKEGLAVFDLFCKNQLGLIDASINGFNCGLHSVFGNIDASGTLVDEQAENRRKLFMNFIINVIKNQQYISKHYVKFWDFIKNIFQNRKIITDRDNIISQNELQQYITQLMIPNSLRFLAVEELYLIGVIFNIEIIAFTKLNGSYGITYNKTFFPDFENSPSELINPIRVQYKLPNKKSSLYVFIDNNHYKRIVPKKQVPVNSKPTGSNEIKLEIRGDIKFNPAQAKNATMAILQQMQTQKQYNGILKISESKHAKWQFINDKIIVEEISNEQLANILKLQQHVATPERKKQSPKVEILDDENAESRSQETEDRRLKTEEKKNEKKPEKRREVNIASDTKPNMVETGMQTEVLSFDERIKEKEKEISSLEAKIQRIEVKKEIMEKDLNARKSEKQDEIHELDKLSKFKRFQLGQLQDEIKRADIEYSRKAQELDDMEASEEESEEESEYESESDNDSESDKESNAQEEPEKKEEDKKELQENRLLIGLGGGMAFAGFLIVSYYAAYFMTNVPNFKKNSYTPITDEYYDKLKPDVSLLSCALTNTSENILSFKDVKVINKSIDPNKMQQQLSNLLHKFTIMSNFESIELTNTYNNAFDRVINNNYNLIVKDNMDTLAKIDHIKREIYINNIVLESKNQDVALYVLLHEVLRLAETNDHKLMEIELNIYKELFGLDKLEDCFNRLYSIDKVLKTNFNGNILDMISIIKTIQSNDYDKDRLNELTNSYINTAKAA